MPGSGVYFVKPEIYLSKEADSPCPSAGWRRDAPEGEDGECYNARPMLASSSASNPHSLALF